MLPRAGTAIVVRWAALFSPESLREKKVKLLPHLGKGGNEGSSASLRYAGGEWTRKPVRLLSEAADVDEAHAFEPGTLLQATEHGHNLALQLRGREGDPRRQLYSFSSWHRVANDGSGNLVPAATTEDQVA